MKNIFKKNKEKLSTYDYYLKYYASSPNPNAINRNTKKNFENKIEPFKYNEMRLDYNPLNDRRTELAYLNAKDKELKKIRRNEKVKSFFKAVFFTPFAIFMRVISLATRFVGVVTAIGIPYGLYSVYMLYQQYNESIPFSEMSHRFTALFFTIFPFIAYFVSHASKLFGDYFSDNV